MIRTASRLLLAALAACCSVACQQLQEPAVTSETSRQPQWIEVTAHVESPAATRFYLEEVLNAASIRYTPQVQMVVRNINPAWDEQEQLSVLVQDPNADLAGGARFVGKVAADATSYTALLGKDIKVWQQTPRISFGRQTGTKDDVAAYFTAHSGALEQGDTLHFTPEPLTSLLNVTLCFPSDLDFSEGITDVRFYSDGEWMDASGSEVLSVRGIPISFDVVQEGAYRIFSAVAYGDIRVDKVVEQADTRANSDGRRRYTATISLPGDIDLPNLKVEAMVGSKFYSATLSETTRRVEAGKAYVTGEVDMQPHAALHIASPGDLAAMEEEARSLLIETAINSAGALVVTGSPSDADLYALRDFALHFQTYSSTGLVSLDLSRTTMHAVPPYMLYKQNVGNVTSLTTLLLPSGVELIGEYAFFQCTALKQLSLPAVTRVGELAFSSCINLASIELPAVEFIDEAAFLGCTSLQQVSLPAVRVIDNLAFGHCSALKKVDVDTGAAEGAPGVTLGVQAFFSCKALTDLLLDRVTQVGSSAFFWCDSLKNLWFISAQKVEANAFAECNLLERVSLYGVKELHGKLFAGCPSLTEINLFSKTLDYVHPNLFTELPAPGNVTFWLGPTQYARVSEGMWTPYDGATPIDVSAFKEVKQATVEIE